MPTTRPARLRVAALISVAAVSACYSHLALAQPRGESKETVITLERGGCFGTCPIYTLRVDGGGEVTYNGRCFVAARGNRRRKIDPAAVKKLVRRAEELGYFDMQEHYDRLAEPACPELSTDNPTIVTSIKHDGRSRTISHDHGCRGLPELKALADFENSIDRTAMTAKWVQHPVRDKGQALYYLREREHCWPDKFGPHSFPESERPVAALADAAPRVN